MTFAGLLKLYAIALPTFLFIDLVWLGIVARSFYQSQIGHLMRANVNWAAALVWMVAVGSMCWVCARGRVRTRRWQWDCWRSWSSVE